MKLLEKITKYLESTPLTFKSWCISFLAIVSIRLLVENLLTSVNNKPLIVFLGSFLQTLLFFLMSYVAILLYLKFVIDRPVKKLATVLLWGQWIIIFPPILDKLIFGDHQYHSFYVFDSLFGVIHRLFTFFGDNPDFGITYGTRIEVLVVSVLLGVYAFVLSKKIFRSIAVALGLYTILFLLGAFPSLVTFVLRGWQEGLLQINSVTVAKVFLTPLRYFTTEIQDLYGPLNFRLNLIYNLVLFGLVGIYQWLQDKERFIALFRNIRFPQTIFNSGLFLIGLGLALLYLNQTLQPDFFTILVILNLLLGIFCAWYFSVFINDVADEKIDAITNTTRPLIKKLFTHDQYFDYSIVFLFFSMTSMLIVGVKFFLLIICYHLFTTVYSAYPFRLKRFVGIASILSSFASLLFLVMGYMLVSPGQSLELFPWRLVSFLFIGYALAIPLKDIKDIEGDRKDGVYTLPVLLGEENARLVLATLIFACYFYSVHVIGERIMWLAALLSGSASFWIITNKKIAPRNVNWQVLLVAAFYVMLLAVIVMAGK